MSKKLSQLACGTALCLILAGPAGAADEIIDFESTKPAVSGINGKIEGGYRYIDVDGLPGHFDAPFIAGAISFPVGHSFGFQADAGLMRVTNSVVPGSITLGGGAGHLFWRDPDMALVGAYVHYLNLNFSGPGPNIDIWRLGAEAELYLDRFSVEGFAGADIVDAPGGNLDFFTGDLYGAFYATDNLRLHAGVVHQFNQTMGRVGGEAMLPFASNNIALFTDGTFGDNVSAFRAGLRVYFGESGKSLIDRHRQDDPKIRIVDFFGFDVEIDVDECPPGQVENREGFCVELDGPGPQ